MSADARPAALLAEAVRRMGVREVPPGSNRSTIIDYWNAEAAAPLGSPWCMAFVRQASVEAVGRSRVPWPRTASVQALVTWAEGKGLVRDISTARPGDLAVWWYDALGRYGHVAVVERVTASTVTTIDGNTSNAAPGSPRDREGFVVARKTRPITSRVKAIAWPALP
jgi:hypothetical protein